MERTESFVVSFDSLYTAFGWKSHEMVSRKNTCVIYILQKGSMKTELNILVCFF